MILLVLKVQAKNWWNGQNNKIDSVYRGRRRNKWERQWKSKAFLTQRNIYPFYYKQNSSRIIFLGRYWESTFRFISLFSHLRMKAGRRNPVPMELTRNTKDWKHFLESKNITAALVQFSFSLVFSVIRANEVNRKERKKMTWHYWSQSQEINLYKDLRV